MTFQEAVDICIKVSGDADRVWHETHLRVLIALGVLKVDDMKPDEEYEFAIRAKETMDQLKPQSSDT